MKMYNFHLGLLKKCGGDYRNQTEVGIFLKNIFGLHLFNKEVDEKCVVEHCIPIML